MTDRAPEDQAVYDRHPMIPQDTLDDAPGDHTCPRCGELDQMRIRIEALIAPGGPLWSVYDKPATYAQEHIRDALDAATEGRNGSRRVT